MGGRPSGQEGRGHPDGRCGPRGRPVRYPAVHRSADGAGGRPRQGGHPDPLAESHPRGGAESCHLPQLHGGYLQDEGDPPRFRVSRRRAQDHRLLRGRRRADRGECPQVYPLPPPLRNQLPHSGSHRQRLSLQCPAVEQHQPPCGLQAAASACGHGHQLRAAEMVRPLG